VKKTIIVLLALFSLILSMAGCRKPDDIPSTKKITITVVNNTSEKIEKVILKPKGKQEYSQQCNIAKGGSLNVDVARGDYYDLVLVDTKNHEYTKKECRWVNDAEVITITDKDFTERDIVDWFKKLFGL
jgi:hypothetical protein